jgi:hypothetical protein
MTRRTRPLTLLAAALILSLAMPALAQAPAAAAKAPAQVAPERTPAPAAALATGAALPLFLQTEGATACSTASSVLAPDAVIIRCPDCPPGWTVCGPYPRCGCCRGDL